MNLAARNVTLPDVVRTDLRQRMAGRVITVDIPRTVRKVLRTQEVIPVAEWAERHRNVTIGAHIGKWRNEISPHTVKIMNAYGMPWVTEVVVCGVEQSGKTNTAYNCLGWAMDCDPGPAMVVMPTEETAKKVSADRIIPIFQQSPQLARLLSSKQDDTAKLKIALNNGQRIYMAWANSAAALATFPIKHLIFDETDKYPERVGKETDPITLGIRRQRTFKHSAKRFIGSTPSRRSGFIYKRLLACQQIWRHELRCPHCHDLVAMDAEHLVLPEGATIESVEGGEHVPEYTCNACGVLWDETDRQDAIASGVWTATKGGELMRPKSVGFHHRAWECSDVTLVEIAVAWLKKKNGDLSTAIAWANGIEAIDYEVELKSAIENDHVLRYRSELPRGLAPRDTALIGLLVDTQQDHFYYEQWAFGYKPTLSMHMIRHGVVQSFDDVAYLLDEFVETVDGRQLPVYRGLIDSGGTKRGYQKHSRTVEVYEWCARHPRMFPLKGVTSRNDGAPISYKAIEVVPGTNKRINIPGFVRVNVVVDLFKDLLAQLLLIEPDDPGALSFHSEIDEGFSRHYSGEVKDEAGAWVHEKRSVRIDFWDCNVYALALRKIFETVIKEAPQDDVLLAPKVKPPRRSGGGFVKGF